MTVHQVRPSELLHLEVALNKFVSHGEKATPEWRRLVEALEVQDYHRIATALSGLARQHSVGFTPAESLLLAGLSDAVEGGNRAAIRLMTRVLTEGSLQWGINANRFTAA